MIKEVSPVSCVLKFVKKYLRCFICEFTIPSINSNNLLLLTVSDTNKMRKSTMNSCVLWSEIERLLFFIFKEM